MAAPLLLLLLCAGPARGGGGLVGTVGDGNWTALLRGEWMLAFSAPWCPSCRNLRPEWERLSEWADDLEVRVAEVDVTAQPGLSGRFVITALPTLYHCKDGEFRRYNGPRTVSDFINFISDREWEAIEPLSSWFGPSSFLMSSMSALFQLSMWIRRCHNYFTEEVGVPVWGSYAIFAAVTLFSGLLLGLMMVFLADCICPSERHKPPQYPYQRLTEPTRPLKCPGKEEDEDDFPDPAGEPPEASRSAVAPNTVRQRAVAPAAATEHS